jgi:hypothetical protein
VGEGGGTGLKTIQINANKIMKMFNTAGPCQAARPKSRLFFVVILILNDYFTLSQKKIACMKRFENYLEILIGSKFPGSFGNFSR